MSLLYTQTALDLGTDPMKDVEYRKTRKMVMHYANLARETELEIARRGDTKLVPDLERRQMKCAQALAHAYELAVQLGRTG